ncbi:phage baseplate assembly protein V (plasmid) [Burkholderia vietnamiensis]|uniref:phage baseplate assembly protein V n=1 Tax=Burkholderia vietnamiensis TaxID=60552 RepID=UPI00159425D9|nr:phage baseplate assembly protein V [Burkholderia vietnamiensis]HDR9100677.1 phage baseplate assembly protein [Burkholderia vietnamiensis]
MNKLGAWLVRGVVSLVNSASKMQTLQTRLMAGGVKDGVEHFEPYGFTSHPMDGAEAIVGFLGGDSSHGVALVVADRRYRPLNLKPGEVAIFTSEGDSLILRNGRIAELTTGTFRVNASEKIELNSPVVEASKEVIAKGRLTAQSGMAVRAGAAGEEAATFDAPIRTPDVIVDGKSTARHRHAETGGITEEMQ